MSTRTISIDATNSLCDELQQFCRDENLPQHSADELLAEEQLTRAQRAYLIEFCRRWDRQVEAPTTAFDQHNARTRGFD